VESPSSKRVYQEWAAIIRERVLLATNEVFQLAFVLTPIGRELNHASDPRDQTEPTAGPVSDRSDEDDPSTHSPMYDEKRLSTHSDCDDALTTSTAEGNEEIGEKGSVH
jgi:hypothetical protein